MVTCLDSIQEQWWNGLCNEIDGDDEKKKTLSLYSAATVSKYKYAYLVVFIVVLLPYLLSVVSFVSNIVSTWFAFFSQLYSINVK